MNDSKSVVIRVLIAGCRNFNDYKTAKSYIDMCISRIRKSGQIIIVSGGANGADKLAERYAAENNFKCEVFLPDWQKFGRSAGPKRNSEMVKVSDFVICFWDKKSNGTKSTIELSKKHNKPLRVKIIQTSLQDNTKTAAID